MKKSKLITKKRFAFATIATILIGAITLNTTLVYPVSYNFPTKPMRELIKSVQNSAFIKAFLSAVAAAEVNRGNVDSGAGGYNILFSNKTFTSYKHHPAKSISRYIDVKGKRVKIPSPAAGRYQILKFVDDDLIQQTGIKSFGPNAQDEKATYLIFERGALRHVLKGKFDEALSIVNSVWSSLPGAKYGQRTVPYTTFCQDLLHYLRKFGAQEQQIKHIRCGYKPITSYKASGNSLANKVSRTFKKIARKLSSKKNSKQTSKKVIKKGRSRPHKKRKYA